MDEGREGGRGKRGDRGGERCCRLRYTPTHHCPVALGHLLAKQPKHQKETPPCLLPVLMETNEKNIARFLENTFIREVDGQRGRERKRRNRGGLVKMREGAACPCVLRERQAKKLRDLFIFP